MYGDIWSPCLISLSALKYSPGILLTKIEKDAVVIHSVIQLNHFSTKSRSVKHFLINYQSNLSYAFSLVSVFLLLFGKGVEDFMCHQDIVMNISTFYERTL